MKKINFILWGLVATMSFNCQKEVGFSLKNNGQPAFSNGLVTIQGNVVDENGQPAIGAKIQIASKATTTNADGYFRIVHASSENNNALVTAEQAGYFKAFRSFIPTSGVNQVMIKLIKKDVSGRVNSTSGGDVLIPNGSKISLPANSIIEESGGNYAGTVNVYVAYIDPTSKNISEAIPGSFMGDGEGKGVVLTSFGMLAVQLESPAGEKLQIAPGSAATLTIPIPTLIEPSAPASVNLWYMNEQTGIWKQEGTAARNGSSYVGKVTHFSYWNDDISGPAVTLSITLKSSSGSPLTFTQVRFTDADGSTCHGITDSLGQVIGLVPANKSLLMEVFADPCYAAVYSKTVGPFSTDADLGTITINTTSNSTISGKLLTCDGTPVTNGYAIINFNHLLRYAATDRSGNFASEILVCPGASLCQILGVDNSANQQGNAITTNIVASEINIGSISACGSSTQEYINCTVDGTDFNIGGDAADTLFGSTYSISPSSTAPNYIYIIGARRGMANMEIDFSYYQDTSPGKFPLSALGLPGIGHVSLIQPFDVTVTNYPQNPGGFYEGNFSGQAMDSLSPAVHTINCSFRVRRQQ